MIQGRQSEPGRALLAQAGTEKIKVAKKRLSREGRVVDPALCLGLLLLQIMLLACIQNSAVPASDTGFPLNMFACERHRLCALEAVFLV